VQVIKKRVKRRKRTNVRIARLSDAPDMIDEVLYSTLYIKINLELARMTGQKMDFNTLNETRRI
jgi:hypothetical protein